MTQVTRIEEIYLSALERSDLADRARYLAAMCGDDAELRAEVEKLLAAHSEAGNFLEPSLDQTKLHQPAAVRSIQPGTLVADRYKLLEKIGEGGMGEVWVADQFEPIKRRVALKLIKPGMDSRSVLARFEAERQALAVMDHPNIAKVLDAGTTGDGRPYFVMELVKGTPITEFADARKLTTKERLELFVPVCQAIQHAHMKGIIHRDIKPSNVLVELHDDRMVAKVIDFGVAKAIGQQLTDKTIYTGFGALVGTPTYMAPEQATFNALDVDTRADVYALGVLLYELLAGSPPIEKERLNQAALDEVLRIVRDEEPPRPSQRLSTSHAKASIAAVRGSEPTHLSQLMKGEIDWIVMKALEKDRTRRYESAHGLAKDLQRYLNGDAVEACPPTLGYRMRKAYRRNRTAVRVASGFVCLIISALAMGTYLAVQARRAEAEAKQAQALAEEKRIEAEQNLETSEHYLTQYAGAIWDVTEGRAKAEVELKSRKIDIALLEHQHEARMGILSLAAIHAKDPGEVSMKFPNFFNGSTTNSILLKNVDGYETLNSFIAAAILTSGQNFAPLLPPISHDGHAVVWQAISPEGNRMLTLGKDGTAILWETATAKLIQILQLDGVRVIDCGFSPDGKTIFTDDQVSVARFWDAGSGQFIAKTEPRPNRYEFPASWSADVVEQQLRPKHLLDREQKTHYRNSLQFGNDRAVTSRSITEILGEDRGADSSIRTTTQYPFELWNTKTGELIASFDGACQLVGDGNFVLLYESDSTTVYCAKDGRKLASYQNKTDRARTGVYSSNRWVAELYAETTTEDGYFEIRDTTNWNAPAHIMKSPLGLNVFDSLGYSNQILLSDNLLAVHSGDYLLVGRPGVDSILKQIRYGERSMDWTPNVVLLEEEVYAGNGQIFDINTGKKLGPPASRKYSPELSRFSNDRRYVPARVDLKNALIDTLTDKCIPVTTNPSFLENDGWECLVAFRRTKDSDVYRNSVVMQLMPLTHLSEIPPDLLQLWVQVLVRGELDANGAFEKWDEKTWNTKLHELAMVSPPIPSFPFPGQIASDKTYWLRCEYAMAHSRAYGFQSGASQSVVAKHEMRNLAIELVRHAEEIGNETEANHWRSELAKIIAEIAQPMQD